MHNRLPKPFQHAPRELDLRAVCTAHGCGRRLTGSKQVHETGYCSARCQDFADMLEKSRVEFLQERAFKTCKSIAFILETAEAHEVDLDSIEAALNKMDEIVDSHGETEPQETE